jgi:AmmeMemoRadiSam system protein A
MIDQATREALLALARAAVDAQVRGQRPPGVPAHLHESAFGAFVTLHRGNELRGCLGTLDGPTRLADAVARLAASVCHEDPRFDPVTAGELALLEIEVSVLTLPERVNAIASIELGRHGVVVRLGSRKGLLLPQVATERGWDRETFLAHACRKAGLPGDAWRGSAEIYRFEAEVFGGRFHLLALDAPPPAHGGHK